MVVEGRTGEGAKETEREVVGRSDMGVGGASGM